MRVLQVNTADMGSGAERAATNLLSVYRARGVESWLAVGHQYLAGKPDILRIPNRASRSAWSRAWYQVRDSLIQAQQRTQWRGLGRAAQTAGWLADFDRWQERKQGHEDFHFPGTQRLLSLPPSRPQLLHCHNLHGAYFDLRLLPQISNTLPTLITLHDMWLFTGHCAYSRGCDRWRNGCGACPDLELYPRLERDGTSYNWHRKQEIWSQSRLYLITPSQWLMNMAKGSMLAPAIVDARVIPNGVDLARFRSGGRAQARERLGLPGDARIVLFSGHALRINRFKDYATVLAALERSRAKYEGRLIFIALGDEGPESAAGQWERRNIPFESDPARVVLYHQAADLYVHAAIDDNFPFTVLESLACGTPVLGTAVGGIGEQVKALRDHQRGEATGELVPPRDPVALAKVLDELIADTELLRQLGENAARDARARFNLERQATLTLQWYEEILAEVGVP